MLIILSQHVDYDSKYDDHPFSLYHFPSRYKNQINTGDRFIYYQGNRYDKSERYYFGTGIVGNVWTENGEDYYADITKSNQFPTTVPIYLPSGTYIESLSYGTVRKSIRPPWQSSIRPISQEAFEYILKRSGLSLEHGLNSAALPDLEDQMKRAIKKYYLHNEDAAILEVHNLAESIAIKKGLAENKIIKPDYDSPRINVSEEKRIDLVQYCKTMHMSYSYKAVLILAMLDCVDNTGKATLLTVTNYFIKFYSSRCSKGQMAEKADSIFAHEDINTEVAAQNILQNPCNALSKAGIISVDKNQVITFTEAARHCWEPKEREQIISVCNERLSSYFQKVKNIKA